MDMTTLAWLAFAVESLALIIAAVWVVAQVKSTTRVLTLSLRDLSKTVDELRKAIVHLDDMVHDHDKQLGILNDREERG